MPGSWNLYLDKQTGSKRWSIDSNSYNIDANGVLELDVGEVLVTTEVTIGGEIYWDFNENSIVESSETIAEANVTVTSLDGTLEFNLTTNEFGVWSQLVPIQNTYNITVNMEGYSTGYYSVNDSNEVESQNNKKPEKKSLLPSGPLNDLINKFANTNYLSLKIKRSREKQNELKISFSKSSLAIRYMLD